MRDPRLILNASHSEKKPSCFNSESQYKEYLYLKRLSGEGHMYRGVCADCTPEYKEEMLAAGRCDHPETVFVQCQYRNMEVETIGVSVEHKYWGRVLKGQFLFKKYRDEDDGEDQ